MHTHTHLTCTDARAAYDLYKRATSAGMHAYSLTVHRAMKSKTKERVDENNVMTDNMLKIKILIGWQWFLICFMLTLETPPPPVLCKLYWKGHVYLFLEVSARIKGTVICDRWQVLVSKCASLPIAFTAAWWCWFVKYSAVGRQTAMWQSKVRGCACVCVCTHALKSTHLC